MGKNSRLIISVIAFFVLLWLLADAKKAIVFTLFIVGMSVFNYGIVNLYLELKGNGYSIKRTFSGKPGFSILCAFLPFIVILFFVFLPKNLLIMSLALSIGILIPLWILDRIKSLKKKN